MQDLCSWESGPIFHLGEVFEFPEIKVFITGVSKVRGDVVGTGEILGVKWCLQVFLVRSNEV